ncbi:hypothetical protein CHS0354_030889 [Potamilus streckersoni]|uniref:Glycosyltransferase family 92 protein n=1 Tax=Potamilus streckersoni TaxID=2493646 RepID=A0AAE0SAI7_9BIVA|nr:hypothetical protein CHS0354_030889 [Potamilus streckersoni]
MQARKAHARTDGSPNSVEFDIGMTGVVHIKDFVDNFEHIKSHIYTQVEHLKLFVYAAIARNISTAWDEFGVTAWIHSGVNPKNASCCFLYSDGALRTTNAWRYSVFMKPEIYVIRFQCANPIPGSKPIGMTLAVSGFACSSNITTYVKPLYPLRPHGNVTIALCTKQAYGNLNPSLVVEWLEYNRNMGVDKVITFVDASNLIENTSEILRYYQKMGFVDIIPYDLPMRGTPKLVKTIRHHLKKSDKSRSSMKNRSLANPKSTKLVKTIRHHLKKSDKSRSSMKNRSLANPKSKFVKIRRGNIFVKIQAYLEGMDPRIHKKRVNSPEP